MLALNTLPAHPARITAKVTKRFMARKQTETVRADFEGKEAAIACTLARYYYLTDK